MNNPEIVRFLLAHQVIAAEDVLDREVLLVDDVRDRYRICQAFVGQEPRCAIKQAISEDGIIRLEQELTHFQLLGQYPALQEILPRVYGIDDSAELLVMDWIGSGQTLYGYSYELGYPPLEAAQKLGEVLGVLHRVTRGISPKRLPQTLPWIFQLFEPQTESWLTDKADVLQLTQQIAVLEKGLAVAREKWNPQCLIHGDLKWENCLLENKTNGLTALRLIDWELASFGDPLWDLAGAMHEYVMFAKYTNNSSNYQVNANLLEILTSPPVLKAILKLVQSYQQAVGMTGDRASVDWRERLSSYMGARLLQTCFEISAMPNYNSADIVPLLQMAATILGNPTAIAQQLFLSSR